MNLSKIAKEEYSGILPAEITTFKPQENENVLTLLTLLKEWLDVSYGNVMEYQYDKIGDYSMGSYNPAKSAAHRLTLLCDKIGSFAKETKDFTPEDITSLCFFMSDFQDHPSFESCGEFFMPLINAHHSQTKNSVYNIITKHIDKKIHVLGKRNAGATIHVHGDVGHGVGEEMYNGTIIVYGNAEERVGSSMNDGIIIIQNHAGEDVGTFMKNGRIDLNGTYQSISRYKIGGEIYWKGKKIK